MIIGIFMQLHAARKVSGTSMAAASLAMTSCGWHDAPP
jgi:hypothetical protein